MNIALQTSYFTCMNSAQPNLFNLYNLHERKYFVWDLEYVRVGQK